MRKRWEVYNEVDGKVWFRCWTRRGANNRAWGLEATASAMGIRDRYHLGVRRADSSSGATT